VRLPTAIINRLDQRKKAIVFFLLLSSLGLAVLLARNIDFRVYWYGATGFFSGTRPAYGPQSGLGAPMDYVYPPATYLLLYPLKWFSLYIAGALWIAAAFACLFFSVLVAITKLPLTFRPRAIVICFVLIAPYLAVTARWGNVQPFVITFLFLAFLLAEDIPWLAGLLFAVAVTFKVTPLFFVPWFIKPCRRKALVFFCVSMLVLWILPVVVFGATPYANLLHDWYQVVHHIGSTPSEFHYFPGQTIRSVCLRLLSTAVPPVSPFPTVNVLSLQPVTAVIIGEIISIVGYIAAVAWYMRAPECAHPLWDGLAFVLYSLLEPFAVKVSLISLGPAALIGAGYFTSLSGKTRDSRCLWASRAYFAAVLLSAIATCVQVRRYLRWLQAVGIDFWISICLGAAFILWVSALRRTRTPATVCAES